MRIPINITGGTYDSPAVQLSAQVTRNWYPELQKDGSYVLQPWFGYTSFSNDQTGSDRGILFHRGVLYKVSGITLYSVDSNGNSTSLGTVQGSLPVVMQGFGKNVLIATGEGKAYEYDTSTVSELTDVDLESPTWVAVLKNFAILGGDEDRFVVSAFSDATSIDALDYARAETAADDLIRGFAFAQELYLFGATTLERWFVSGVGRPPLAFRDSAPIGIASRMSVAKNDRYMYWLSDDRKVYRAPGLEPVATIGVSNSIENYTTVDDAIGFCCTKQGQNFYHLTFPTENETWLYCEAVNEWVNLSDGTTGGRSTANSYAYAYGKHLVGDYSGQEILEWNAGDFQRDNFYGSIIVENLIDSPNDFSSADWTQQNTVTVTANTEMGPDGSVTADTIADADAGALGAFIQADAIDITKRHTTSVYIKKDITGRATRFAQVYILFTTGGVTETNVIDVDTSTGDYNLSTSDSTDVDGSVESVTAGWWRVHISATPTDQSNVNCFVYVVPAAGASASWTTSAATTGSIIAWGAAMYEGELISAYEEIERERITLPLDGQLLGYHGGSVELNRFELFMEMGVGTPDETDPKVCLQVSTNRGKTFGTERWAPVGKSGEFKNRVIWNNLGRAESFVFKIKASDNAQFSIRNAAVDVEIGT